MMAVLAAMVGMVVVMIVGLVKGVMCLNLNLTLGSLSNVLVIAGSRLPWHC